jgi:hypothetical protein
VAGARIAHGDSCGWTGCCAPTPVADTPIVVETVAIASIAIEDRGNLSISILLTS